jgi:hypothetical protein
MKNFALNVSPIPSKAGLRRMLNWTLDSSERALILLGLQVKARLFPNRLSDEQRLMLSFMGDPRFNPRVSPMLNQIEAARALSSGSSAQEALLNGQLTYPDAQLLAIQKLESPEQVEAVYRAHVVCALAAISLQSRYQKLGGTLDSLRQNQD